MKNSENKISALFTNLLATKPGIVIGEGHYSRAQYKVLINNMKQLSQAGVKYIFAEFFNEDMRPSLDVLYTDLQPASRNKPLSETSQQVLRHSLVYDTMYRSLPPDEERTPAFHATMYGHLLNNAPLSPANKELMNKEAQQCYNMLHLVQEAAVHGIHIVPVDRLEYRANSVSAKDRHQLLSENITRIVKLTAGQEKYLVTVGANHAQTAYGVPGVKERLGVPDINIRELGAAAVTNMRQSGQLPESGIMTMQKTSYKDPSGLTFTPDHSIFVDPAVCNVQQGQRQGR